MTLDDCKRMCSECQGTPGTRTHAFLVHTQKVFTKAFNSAIKRQLTLGNLIGHGLNGCVHIRREDLGG